MKRHAYLIMAHDKPCQLMFLLRLLDDKRNDIYLHIDKKANGVDREQLKQCIHESQLYFVPQENVNWGGYFQIKTELNLIRNAVMSNERYNYLHLLSGSCMPIKSQDYIHNFFHVHEGEEFVQYDAGNDGATAHTRLQYYNFWQNRIGGRRGGFLYYLRKVTLKIQQILQIDRTAEMESDLLHKGPNWFSITGNFAEWVLTQERFIQKHFRHTVCADEVLLQTLIGMSPFCKMRHNDSLRYTDWIGGQHPRTLTIDDGQKLASSSALFARKFDFDEHTDGELARLILKLNGKWINHR